MGKESLTFAEEGSQNKKPEMVTNALFQKNGIISEIECEPGTILDADDCQNTIPRFPDGWRPVCYNNKRSLHSELYYNVSFDDKPDVDVEKCKDYDIDVYRHAIDQMRTPQNPFYDEFVNDAGETIKSWEAFDIPYVANWKEIVARFIGGLTESELAIVRLLKENTNSSTNYLSLYMLNSSFSTIFTERKNEERKQIANAESRLERGELTMSEYKRLIHPEPIEIRYDIQECLDLGGEYAAVVSAFAYCWFLNGDHPFSIIEQIFDEKNGGTSTELITKIEAKTEIREEFNIFTSKIYPESVFTNFRPQTFICNLENGCFVIRRKR